MKFYHVKSAYLIMPIEADSVEDAARKAIAEPDPARRGKKSKSKVTRTPRGKSVTILDTTTDKLRDFELAPPPPPPVEEWEIREITDDEEEDDDVVDDDERF